MVIDTVQLCGFCLETIAKRRGLLLELTFLLFPLMANLLDLTSAYYYIFSILFMIGITEIQKSKFDSMNLTNLSQIATF